MDSRNATILIGITEEQVMFGDVADSEDKRLASYRVQNIESDEFDNEEDSREVFKESWNKDRDLGKKYQKIEEKEYDSLLATISQEKRERVRLQTRNSQIVGENKKLEEENEMLQERMDILKNKLEDINKLSFLNKNIDRVISILSQIFDIKKDIIELKYMISLKKVSIEYDKKIQQYENSFKRIEQILNKVLVDVKKIA